MPKILKKIIAYLKEYLVYELKPWYLLSVLLFLGGYVFVEYYFHCTNWLEIKYHDTISDLIIQFIIYLFPFACGYLMYSFHYKDWSLWHSPLFWFLLVFAPIVFSLRSFINYFSEELYSLLPSDRTAYFYYKCLAVVIRDLLVFIPIYVYWRIKDKSLMPNYGFTLKNYDTKPYLIMLGIMIPLVVIASYQNDFLSQYPKGFHLYPLSIDNAEDQKYFFIYELFYGFDFIFIEYFFRGFLLLAFYRHFGWSCLLPMACFYVTIHFGKPLGETVSSFFGGTILGILAIRTGSIAGGIIVHMGVAWLMEYTALLHKIF